MIMRLRLLLLVSFAAVLMYACDDVFVEPGPPSASVPEFSAASAAPSSVTIAGDLQEELGCPGDWQPDCADTHLSYDAEDDVWQGVFNVPAGSWQYKAALNDSWDENYGANAQLNGPNIPLNLPAATDVKFYYDHETHWVTDNVNSVIAVAPGNFQSELGCSGDWDPSCLRSWLQDPDGDGEFTFTTRALPAGSYEAKVAIDESWAVNFGAGGVQNGPNIPFTVPESCTEMHFSYNDVSHVLAVGTAPPGPDNEPPLADAGGPYEGDEGSPITFDGSGSSDTDGTIETYEWDLDGDGDYDDATGVTVTVTPDDNSSYAVGLRVTDDDGASATDDAEVNVYNVAPTVDAGEDATVYSGEVFSQDGSFGDPGSGDTHEATVDYGDGAGPASLTLTDHSFVLTHVYFLTGSYVVTVEVVDDDGGAGVDVVEVTVVRMPVDMDIKPGSDPRERGLRRHGNRRHEPQVWTGRGCTGSQGRRAP